MAPAGDREARAETRDAVEGGEDNALKVTSVPGRAARTAACPACRESIARFHVPGIVREA